MKCKHGMRMDRFGERCANRWCKLQYDIRKRHHSLKEIPWPRRFFVRLLAPQKQLAGRADQLIQVYVVIVYKGNEYFKRFGHIRFKI